MRSLKLEELRRRLLQPDSVDPVPLTIKSGRQVSSTLPIFVQQLVDEGARQKNTLTNEEHPSAQSSSEAVSLSEPIVLEKDGEAAAAAGSNPKVLAAPTEKAIGHTDVSSANPLALAIDKLFEPARQCQQRLREITQSCDVINQPCPLHAGAVSTIAEFWRPPAKTFEGILGDTHVPRRTQHTRRVFRTDRNIEQTDSSARGRHSG